MSYTPGPWETREPRTTQNLVSHYVQSESENLAICKVLKDEYRTSEVAEANARLIATAPDLLEALLEVNNRYASLMTEKMRNKMRSAINKARGI